MNTAVLVVGCLVLMFAAGCGSSVSGPVKVGDTAPEFELKDTAGETVSLGRYRGRIVVMFFYPKDNSSICTKEVCLFRDSYEVFQEQGAVLFGISSDTLQSHEGFAKAQSLNFPLLADEGGVVRKRYGVPKSAGIIPGRVTYVIDKEGVVRMIFNSQLDAGKHVTEALQTVRELNGQATP